MKLAFDSEDSVGNSKALINQFKEAVDASKQAKKDLAARKNPPASEDETNAAKAHFIIEKKKLKVIRESFKKFTDARNAAIAKAKEEAQAALDAAKAVKLTPKQKLDIV
jgi:hypothetical protein